MLCFCVMKTADFLAAIECTTKGWHQAPDDSPLDVAVAFAIDQSREVKQLSRGLFPGGAGVYGSTCFEDACQLVAAPATKTVYEPAFRAGTRVAKVDILSRDGGGWNVIEVKSSFPESSKMEAGSRLADVASGVGHLHEMSLEFRVRTRGGATSPPLDRSTSRGDRSRFLSCARRRRRLRGATGASRAPCRSSAPTWPPCPLAAAWMGSRGRRRRGVGSRRPMRLAGCAASWDAAPPRQLPQGPAR